MLENEGRKWLPVLIAAVVVGLVAGWWGYSAGQKAGYAKAQADVKAQQEALAQKAAGAAAKAANPFQTVNPLQGVTANPFEAAAKKLNPFAK